MIAIFGDKEWKLTFLSAGVTNMTLLMTQLMCL